MEPLENWAQQVRIVSFAFLVERFWSLKTT